MGRAGNIYTPHGVVQTPAFIIVGTKSTVKGVHPDYLKNIHTQAVLANTYHLYLQPGDDIVAQGGGIGAFMNWQGPTFTDSGGFQVFSLGEAFGTKVSKVASGEIPMVSETDRTQQSKAHKLAHIDEEGVTFKSHINGSLHRFTPERSMEIQWNLGADIIFAFDECTSPLAGEAYQRQAMDRTHRWALRSLVRHNELDPEKKQALFAVVQGGRFEHLRQESARILAEMITEHGDTFDGFGIGGSFNKNDMGTAVKWVNEILPEDKPRHLLGIGEPRDIFEAVEQGCDTFDCVSPTRIARTGTVYTTYGPINLMNARFKTDFSPIDTETPSEPSLKYTRAYLAHLFRAKEMMGPILASMHNVFFMVKLVADIRQSILDDRFYEFKKEFMDKYYGGK
ncbi:MAG: tRNA guanosine(34) transglycosylase Tgt [Candidatus Pacebacteria bacterium]|nr:tRNA guanosine(34) transglycosylase Tgt [Candidatus Paceibacterota bacterium]